MGIFYKYHKITVKPLNVLANAAFKFYTLEDYNIYVLRSSLTHVLQHRRVDGSIGLFTGITPRPLMQIIQSLILAASSI
jgi:hypothetical protein